MPAFWPCPRRLLAICSPGRRGFLCQTAELGSLLPLPWLTRKGPAILVGMKTDPTSCKLAELLAFRADLQKKVELLRERVAEYAVSHGGAEPGEDPEALLNESLSTVDRLRAVIVRIHEANSSYRLPDGRTLTEAIAEKEALARKHKLLHEALQAVSPSRSFPAGGGGECRRHLDPRQIRRQMDDLAERIRRLNLSLQAANWQCTVAVV